jgi:hypothetical protein
MHQAVADNADAALDIQTRVLARERGSRLGTLLDKLR